MLARISSSELTKWLALFHVEAEEAEERRQIADAGGDEVIFSGREQDEDDDGDDWPAE